MTSARQTLKRRALLAQMGLTGAAWAGLTPGLALGAGLSHQADAAGGAVSSRWANGHCGQATGANAVCCTGPARDSR